MKAEDLENLKEGQELKFFICKKSVIHGKDEIHFMGGAMFFDNEKDIDIQSDEFNPLCDECYDK